MKYFFVKGRFILVLVLVPFVFFFPSLFTYFAQDDFFLLSVSRINVLSDVLAFFIPRPEVVWYRPLSSQIFFFVARSLFGLQPIFYHLAVITTHVVTMIWLYKLLVRLSLRRELSFLSAMVYGSHQIHVVSISWLASYSFVLGPLFLVLLLYYSHSFRFTKALLIFILGVLTTEFFIMLTPLYSWNEFIFTGKINIKRFFWFSTVSVAVVYLRLVAFPARFSSELYTLGNLNKFVPTLKFYLLRIGGTPLLYDTLPLLLQLLSFLSVVICVGFLIAGIYAVYQARISLPKWLLVWSGVALASLFPFLLLSSHVAPYYLSFTLLTLIPVIIWFISHSKFFKKLVLGRILLLIFLFVNTVGIFWTYETHWIFRRAKLAQKLVEQRDFTHEVGSEEYISLGADSAIQVFESHLNFLRR